MDLLILGGTRFVGRHIVSAALARGHQLTLFNRGQHSREELPEVEIIQGDRKNDLDKLRGRRWDAVIDTCGHLPRTVKSAAEGLADSVDRYVFISSQSAYADVSSPGVDEASPLATLTTEQLDQAEAIDASGATSFGALYGGLKALSERAAEEAMPNRVLIIRPGLIVGPYDYSDRFTYWVVRVARGGEVLAPGRPERVVRFIDARDLAEWTIKMVEERATGAYNAIGPVNSLTMKSVLEECKLVSDSDAVFTWVSEAFLRQENVAAWSEMPLWLPEEDAPRLQGFMFVSTDKAIAAGLSVRPLRETVVDTFHWARTNLSNATLKAGIDAAREEMLLRKWPE